MEWRGWASEEGMSLTNRPHPDPLPEGEGTKVGKEAKGSWHPVDLVAHCGRTYNPARGRTAGPGNAYTTAGRTRPRGPPWHQARCDAIMMPRCIAAALPAGNGAIGKETVLRQARHNSHDVPQRSAKDPAGFGSTRRQRLDDETGAGVPKSGRMRRRARRGRTRQAIISRTERGVFSRDRIEGRD